MWLDRFRLRFEGLYISRQVHGPRQLRNGQLEGRPPLPPIGRNTYVKQGVAEWSTRKSLYVAVYFRYFRFLPDGRFLYRCSPDVPRNVARGLRRAGGLPRGDHHHENGEPDGLLPANSTKDQIIEVRPRPFFSRPSSRPGSPSTPHPTCCCRAGTSW